MLVGCGNLLLVEQETGLTFTTMNGTRHSVLDQWLMFRYYCEDHGIRFHADLLDFSGSNLYSGIVLIPDVSGDEDSESDSGFFFEF